MKSPLRRWWRSDVNDQDRAQAVYEGMRDVRERNAERRQMALEFACLYGDGGLEGLASTTVTREKGPTLQFNVVRRAIDTVHAKTVKARPLPMACTTGGDTRAQRRAQKLSRFFAGVFTECEVFETGEQVARDALIVGSGISRTFREGDKIRHERVLGWEVDVDKLDARYGKPRTVYIHTWVDREELVAKFPDHEAAIDAASSAGFEETARVHDPHGDRVVVVEAWRLPIRNHKGELVGGRYVKVVNAANGMLVDDEYEREYVPIHVLHFAKPLMGFWGDGMAHLIRGIQEELNSVAMRVQDAHYGTGTYIVVDKGSGVETDHLDNGTLTVIETNPGGRPPQVVTPDATSVQTMEYLGALRGPWGLDEAGVSQLSARSEKPAGLDSAVAMRTFSDVESERFLLFGRGYERYFVDIAWLMFDLADEIASDRKSFVVRVKNKRNLERLDFKEVRVDRKELTLDVFPTSALSREPAARMAQVAQYVKEGLIPAELARHLLDIPDLEDFNATEDAPRVLIEDILARYADADDPTEPDLYVYPEPAMNLELCVKLATLHYLRGKLDGLPEENLSLMMTFATDAQSEIEKMLGKAAEEAQGAPPGDMPPGPPMPPGMPPPGAMPPPMMPPVPA